MQQLIVSKKSLTSRILVSKFGHSKHEQQLFRVVREKR